MAELEDGTLSFEARLELVSKDVQNVQQQLQQIGKVGESVGNKIDVSLNDAFGNLTKSLGGSTEAVVNKLNELVSVSQTSASAVQQQLQNIQDKLQQSFDARIPEKHFDTISTGARKAGDSIENELTPVIEKATKALKSMVAGFTVQQIITQIGKTRGEFQQLEVAFETMLGSEERSSKLMNELVNTAAHTPFDLKGIADGAKQLLAYGFAAEDVNDTLVMLGNVASGLSIPLNDIVYLYGTTMTQGRLFTQDLRQFMGRGIPLAEELSKQFGVAKNEVGDLVTAGKVGFNEVATAMKAMTSEGGQFYNLMDKQSKTINGLVSNLGDAVDMMLNDIGQQTEGVFATALKFGIDTVENYKAVGKAIVELLAVLGPVKATMIVVNMLQERQNKILREAVVLRTANTKAGIQMSNAEVVATVKTEMHTKAVKRLNLALTRTGLTNPYVILAASAAALGLAIYKAVTYQNTLNETLSNIEKDSAKNDAAINEEIVKLDTLKGKLEGCKEGSDDYLAVKKQIVEHFSQYDETLKDEGASYDELKTKLDNLTESIRNSLSARAAEQTLATEQGKLTEKYAETIESLNNRLKNSLSPEMAARAGQEIGTALAKGVLSAQAKAIDPNSPIKKYFLEIKGVSSEVAEAIKNIGWGYNTAQILNMINALKGLNTQMAELPKLVYGQYGISLEEADKAKSEAEKKKMEEEEKKRKEEEKKKEEDEAKKKAEERKKRMEKEAANLKKQTEETQLQIEQAEIDGLEEGANKTMRHIQLNYKRRLLEMKRQEEEFKRQNKENGLAEALSEKQQKVIGNMQLIADKERDNALNTYTKQEKEAFEKKLKDRLDAWKNFSAKYAEIVDKYDKESVDVDNNNELNKTEKKAKKQRLVIQRDNELSALIAQMGISEQDVANELVDIIKDSYSLASAQAVEALQNELKSVQTQLQEIFRDGVDTYNENQVKQLQAREAGLQKALSKSQDLFNKQGTSADKTGKTIRKKMTDAADVMVALNDTISDVRGEFGDLFSTVTNDSLDMVQTLLSTGVSVLNTLQATGVAVGKSISYAEKASVILTIIQAAIQVTMAMVKVLMNFTKNARLQNQIDALAEDVERLENAYTKAVFAHRKLTGVDYFRQTLRDSKLLEQALHNIQEEIKLTRQQMDNAITDKGRKKYQENLDALEEQERNMIEKIESIYNNFYENVLAVSSKDFASSLTDSLVEAFDSGMKDMTSVFDDAMNDMLKSLISAQMKMELEKLYEPIIERFKNRFGENKSTVNQSDIDAFVRDIEAVENTGKQIADGWRTLYDALGLNTGDLAASTNALQGMTQDTAEELNGRFTALQMSGASIDLKMDRVTTLLQQISSGGSGMLESFEMAVALANDQLQVLEDIRTNTARLAAVERGIVNLNSQLSTLTGQ